MMFFDLATLLGEKVEYYTVIPSPNDPNDQVNTRRTIKVWDSRYFNSKECWFAYAFWPHSSLNMNEC